MKKILTCSCFNMKKKASEAFYLLTGGKEVLPDIIKGKDSIHKFAKEVNNDHIMAISKLTGKFAYYVELEDGKIVKEWDLVRGKRVA